MNNNFENNDKKINTENGESNNAKRLRMLGDSADENIHLRSDADVKGAFWPNFWFKYKWHVIITLGFLIIFAVAFVQMLLKTDYDVTVMYAGPTYCVVYKDDYERIFQEASKDYNGDGENHLLFNSTVYMTIERIEQAAKDNENDKLIMIRENQKSHEAFQNQMMAGTPNFFLLDPSLYEEYKDAFGNISELIGYELDSDMLYADDAIYFKKTALAKAFASEDCLKQLPDDTLICILDKHVMIDEEELNNAKDLLKSIIEYQK